MADLGNDGMGGAPGGVDPPHIGDLGAKPQKLKPTNTLKLLRKRSGDVNVKCIVDNALLIFAQFLHLQRVCANLLSVP